MKGHFSNTRGFLLFAGPATFAFASIIVVSFVAGILLTFTDWTGLSDKVSFVGLDNYAAAVADPTFWDSLWLTARYVILVVVLSNAAAFLFAYALSSRLPLQNLLRAGFFTPNLIGGIVLGFIWYFIFTQGLVAVGTALGIDFLSSSWLASDTMAFWALVIVSVWQISGFLMVIYIAGLTTLPRDVLEAAAIDGAGRWQQLRMVVLPLMRPSFTICVFLTLGRAFMTYDMNLALTNGGPYGSTVLVAMHVYRTAFISEQFGVGQAQALVLFLIVAVISLIQVSISRRGEVQL
jgi:raffinose/stachyose/melibiose transport system permease protein